MEEKYEAQRKHLNKKIDNLNFWVGRLTENDSKEEWGLKLLKDKRMTTEIRDSLEKKHFSIETLPLQRTLIKEKDYNRMQNNPIDKEYFLRRIYFNFIDSRSIEELEKHIEITTLHGKNQSYNDVIVKANWKNI